MLQRAPDVPEGILALEAVGTVTAEDFEQAVEPEIARARREGRRLRILLRLGADYEGFTAGAVREKIEIWLRTPALARWVDGYALVSDIRWVGALGHLAGLVLAFPLRVFGEDEFDAALTWLETIPERPGLAVS